MNNILFLVCTITSISLLIWLGGRGAILSYLIGLIVSLAIMYKHHQLKIKRLLRLVFLIIVSVIVSTPLNIYSWNGLNRLLETRKYYSQDINAISTNRIELWRLSWEFIKEKPFFGYGAESFLLNSETIFRHPHNFIVQWLFDFGAIGTLLFLSFIIFTIITGYSNVKSKLRIKNLISIVIFVGILSNGLISGTLYYSPSFFILCIVSAFILSTPYRFVTRNRYFTVNKDNKDKDD
ncbi:O-antigen ligase family protein [Vibrio sp. YIC-376]|uniref:O-antigen ligase family protein n=1 Tax=Vibrio sp. YIC-376 TaxID=3136162 RepID=UPI00402A6D95